MSIWCDRFGRWANSSSDWLIDWCYIGRQDIFGNVMVNMYIWYMTNTDHLGLLSTRLWLLRRLWTAWLLGICNVKLSAESRVQSQWCWCGWRTIALTGKWERELLCTNVRLLPFGSMLCARRWKDFSFRTNDWEASEIIDPATHSYTTNRSQNEANDLALTHLYPSSPLFCWPLLFSENMVWSW